MEKRISRDAKPLQRTALTWLKLLSMFKVFMETEPKEGVVNRDLAQDSQDTKS